MEYTTMICKGDENRCLDLYKKYNIDNENINHFTDSIQCDKKELEYIISKRLLEIFNNKINNINEENTITIITSIESEYRYQIFLILLEVCKKYNINLNFYYYNSIENKFFGYNIPYGPKYGM